MEKRYPQSLSILRFVMKRRLNRSDRSSNELTDPGGSWLNQDLATPFSVDEKSLHRIASLKLWSCKVFRKQARWSSGSVNPSKLSKWGCLTLRGKTSLRILAVNGVFAVKALPLPPIHEYRASSEHGGVLTAKSPFIAEILREVLPLNVRQPHLESFEGLTNPDDHLACFLNTLQLHNFSYAILYKLFSSTLKGVARSWFSQLPPGSISSFEDLSDRFKRHFMTNRKIERDCGYLFSIKQKSDESLKDFVQRFNRAMLEVPAIDTRVAAAAAVHGVLANSPFHLSIM